MPAIIKGVIIILFADIAESRLNTLFDQAYALPFWVFSVLMHQAFKFAFAEFDDFNIFIGNRPMITSMLREKGRFSK